MTTIHANPAQLHFVPELLESAIKHRNACYCGCGNSFDANCKCGHSFGDSFLIFLSFITGNSNLNLELLLDGLFAQIHVDLSKRGFGRNRTWDLRITQIC